MKALSREEGRKRCHASGCGVSGGAKYEMWSASQFPCQGAKPYPDPLWLFGLHAHCEEMGV